MTPAEAKALTAAEYVAFLYYMDRDLKAQRKAARAKGRG